MTTFTRVLLNPSKRGGRKLLTDPQSMHAAVSAAFPPDLNMSTGRVLWRVDSQAHEHVLYIAAPEAPEAGHIVEQAGWASRPAQTIDYDPLLDRLRVGDEWQFRLRANPVRSVRNPEDRTARGKVSPHVTAAFQLDWLLHRAENHGFEILVVGEGEQAVPQAQVSRREQLHFRRQGAAVTIQTAQFEGLLRVTDRAKFRNALTRGIGRAKAYGCGLLTLRKRPME